MSDMQIACFRVGDGDYAVNILHIKEVINAVTVSRVPSAPDFVEGLIELRGAYLPLIDLRRRFGTPIEDGSTKYVIATIAGNTVALAVDSVSEVRRVASDSVQPTPALAVGPSQRFFCGVLTLDDRAVLLVDLESVLGEDERAQLTDMATEG